MFRRGDGQGCGVCWGGGDGEAACVVDGGDVDVEPLAWEEGEWFGLVISRWLVGEGVVDLVG